MNRILMALPRPEAEMMSELLTERFIRYTFSARALPTEDNPDRWGVLVKQPPSQRLLTFAEGAESALVAAAKEKDS